MSLLDKGNDDSDWNIQRTINFKTSDTNEQESIFGKLAAPCNALILKIFVAGIKDIWMARHFFVYILSGVAL